MGLLDFNLSDVGGILTSAREAITGEKIKDPTEMAKVNLQLQALENALTTGQLKINEAEARSTNWFVAGGRPFIMWVCGFALLYATILEPFARFIAVLVYGYTGSFPVIDTNLTMQILLGLLGLGGMRSFEKYKGVHNER